MLYFLPGISIHNFLVSTLQGHFCALVRIPCFFISHTPWIRISVWYFQVIQGCWQQLFLTSQRYKKWKQIATGKSTINAMKKLFFTKQWLNFWGWFLITSSPHPLFHKETGVGAFAGHFEAKLFIGPNGWSICLLHLQTKIGATVKMHAKFPIISWDAKQQLMTEKDTCRTS